MKMKLFIFFIDFLKLSLKSYLLISIGYLSYYILNFLNPIRSLPLNHPIAFAVEQKNSIKKTKKLEINSWRKKIKANPKDLKTRKKLGKALISLGKNKEAISLLNPFRDELDFSTLKTLEETYLKEKDFKGQVKLLEFLILKFKDKPQHKLLLRLGKALLQVEEKDKKLKLKNENQAVKYFRKSIEINPKYSPPYEALIEFFKKKKAYYEALSIVYDKGQQFKKDLSHYSNLCELYSKRKVKIETIESCNQAISMNPNEPLFYFYQIKAYQDSGDIGLAKETRMKLIKKFPKSHLVYEKIGTYYLEEKEFTLAHQYLTQANQLNPKSLDSQLALAKVLFELGHYEKALYFFLKVCQLSKKVPPEFKLASARLRKNQENKDLAHTFNLNAQNCLHKKTKSSEIVIERFEREKNFLDLLDLKKEKSTKKSKEKSTRKPKEKITEKPPKKRKKPLKKSLKKEKTIEKIPKK